MSRYTLPAAIFAAMLLAGSLDASSGGLREREPSGRETRHPSTSPAAPTAVAGGLRRRADTRSASLSLSSSRRTIGYGQIKFDGLGPERWAAKWRKQRREHRRDVKWLKGELAKARPKRTLASTGSVGYWAAKQIAAAEILGRESVGDPWPNCPDLYDGGGASWYDTVACENGGNWLDSPGYYRCGLQFDPGWERRFGRLCP